MTKPSEHPAYYAESRQEIFQLLKGQINKALDVGCGTGVFASNVKKSFNAEVWGIEYQTDAAKSAELVLDKVFTGAVENHIENLPENYFDAIFFNDVLEHLTAPEKVVESLKSKLNNQGCIMASIPNFLFADALFPMLRSRDWRYTESGIFDRTHFRFFTRKSILRFFEDAGFEVIEIKGINVLGGIRWRFLNAISFGFFTDFLPMQYFVTARLKSSTKG